MPTERITGPLAGRFYIGAYVFPVPEGFASYAKICTENPGDLWACGAKTKVAGGTHTCEAMALESAESEARQMVAILAQLWSAGFDFEDGRTFRRAMLEKILASFL